jgi:hypothetical protein
VKKAGGRPAVRAGRQANSKAVEDGDKNWRANCGKGHNGRKRETRRQTDASQNKGMMGKEEEEEMHREIAKRKGKEEMPTKLRRRLKRTFLLFSLSQVQQLCFIFFRLSRSFSFLRAAN